MPEPRLVTIGVSHYCEKARWGLERANIPFTEETHAPLLHAPFAYAHGKQRTTPILVTPHGTVCESTDILKHADLNLEEKQRLFPSEPALLREVQELETLFDEKLGPATRRLTYFYLLDTPRLLGEIATARVSSKERLLFKLGQKPIFGLIRRGLRVNAEGARRSRERIDGIFEEVAKRLEKSRAYLVGERFTAADLTFAALTAPLVLPPEYGWPLPALHELPEAMRVIVEGYRAQPAGMFVLKLFRELRHQKA
jgi:glutathione S-transferase